MRKDYELHMFTWTGCTGPAAGLEITHHDTPAEALTYVRRHAEPFAVARLFKNVGSSEPCDWAGSLVSARNNYEQWPIIKGANGDHPAYTAMLAEWSALVAEVRQRYESRPDGERVGMGIISSGLLREKYSIVRADYYEQLAWDAAGEGQRPLGLKAIKR